MSQPKGLTTADCLEDQVVGNSVLLDSFKVLLDFTLLKETVAFDFFFPVTNFKGWRVKLLIYTHLLLRQLGIGGGGGNKHGSIPVTG